jgi:hypothetical protein
VARQSRQIPTDERDLLLSEITEIDHADEADFAPSDPEESDRLAAGTSARLFLAGEA